MSEPANKNGHRRRELRRRVIAASTHCGLCDLPLDKTLGFVPGKHGAKCRGNCTGCVPHDQRVEVDEIIPRAHGGNPLDRRNVICMHRACNRFKSTLSLAEARRRWAQKTAQTPPSRPEIVPSPGW